MNRKVEKQINKIYEAVFKKIFNRQRLKAATQGNIKEIEKAITNLSNSRDFKKFCEKFSKQLASKGLTHQKGIWKKFYQAAKESNNIVLPSTYSEFEKKIMKEAVEHNFRMIKSVPTHILNVYKQKDIQVLISQVAENKVGRNTFVKQLQNHGYKNAKLIARTETAKLQTFIDEKRATNLGSVAYIWLASHDKRTRQSHKEMNDVVVFWRKDSEKPLLDKMRGNAGEFPNCRCTPLPILDEDDLTKSTYIVYDYRNDKKITLKRAELLKCLEKGSL